MSALIPVLCTAVFGTAGIASVAVIVHSINSNAGRIIALMEAHWAIERDLRVSEADRRARELSADGAVTTAALLTIAHNTARTRFENEDLEKTRHVFVRHVAETVSMQHRGATIDQLLQDAA